MTRKQTPTKSFLCFRTNREPTESEAEEIRLRKLRAKEYKEAQVQAACDSREYNETPVRVLSFGSVRRNGRGTGGVS